MVGASARIARDQDAVSRREGFDEFDKVDAFNRFIGAYPEFASTSRLDILRTTEYSRLDATRHVYLDYTGGALYAERQLRKHLALLGSQVFGNPHSRNPTSCAMNELIEKARRDVLRFFNASPDEYMVIFTPNATGALKLVGESYPFRAGSIFALTADNHNSVNGIREFARRKGASIAYAPIVAPDLRVDRVALSKILAGAPDAPNKLFAYPAQSNFSGVQHPIEWIAEARAHGWDVLLDAAAFVPTNRLDLSVVHPDYVDISFYKIFGYPTGIGCLLARRAAVAKLVKPWYAGGTIAFSTVATQGHYLASGPARFEDGTVNYLSLPAVSIGLDFIQSVGIDVIHRRVMCLTGWLLDQLTMMRHGNGRPLVRIYGPTTTRERGATLQMNFFDADGARIDAFTSERLASAQRISLRAGCHCNPGAREAALGFTRDDLAGAFSNADGISFNQFRRRILKKTVGALRLSLGLATNFADVSRFLQFAGGFIDKSVGELPRGRVSTGCPVGAA